jgi:DNA-binding response OmpR family regulator
MSKRILILEDHAMLASMIHDLFTNHGWEVTIAGDGRQGLDRAQEGGWTAIITDLKMPLMDGMQFLNAINDHPPTNQNGPLIIYSNFAYSYAKDEALRRGAADFIAKDTMDPAALVNRVEELVNQHQPPPVQEHQSQSQI